MELTCDACQATIQIPDERVPPNATFRVTCPRCKQKIVASSKPPEPSVNGRGGGPPTAKPLEATSAPADTSEEFPEEAVEPSHPGQHTALLCMDEAEARMRIKSALEGMGYAVSTAMTPQHALQRLRFGHYHVIVLDDAFGGTSSNPVARYLAPLTMSVRREMFVILVGEQFKTSDHLQAFVNSVDLVLHPSDLAQLATILEGALADHERFYKVFNECLVAAGKKL
ncbi:MAG: zinc-ribbon domain-containing protein [Nitrospinae bacterium]|nr:zinc-ribbon domain-containing protein [Nitrospinota bacterium]